MRAVAYVVLGGITPAWAGKRLVGIAQEAWQRDYPRVGGEEGCTRRGCSSATGLPPRGRGRDEYVATRDAGDGITPAWAGKSVLQRAGRRGVKDYPRVGGEEPSARRPPQPDGGLPPRGRGRARR